MPPPFFRLGDRAYVEHELTDGVPRLETLINCGLVTLFLGGQVERTRSGGVRRRQSRRRYTGSGVNNTACP
ncbi:MAG TPA: hypothetical protein PJ982_11740 [Lacipirellulaceae bacterium]|nr:hypothetical protein [Lacipirellulaceae bacterium]